jgi:hypothetical protein
MKRIVLKQEQAFANARKLNLPRNVKRLTSRKWRRFSYWMRVGISWQDKAIAFYAKVKNELPA